MDADEAVAEVQRCAAALTKALNEAQELGEICQIEIVSARREGGRSDRREVLVTRVPVNGGRRPEELNSANDS